MKFMHPLPHRPYQAPRVVIAGGGPAAVEALIALRTLAEDLVTIELLAPGDSFVYRPLVVAEVFGLGEEHRFDLATIAADHGAQLRRDALVSVDPERHVLTTAAGDEVGYDALVVALGAQPHRAVPGAICFAGAADVAAVQAAIADAEAGKIDKLAFVAPGGVTWALPLYELALMTASRLAAAGSHTKVTLVTAEERPLGLFGRVASEHVDGLLAEAGIEVFVGEYAQAFERGHLWVVPERKIDADRVVALPVLEGPALPGLPHDTHGFITVNPYCAVTGAPDAYAAGDASNFPLKQGGIATQEADCVAQVLAARAGANLEPMPFRPVLRGMLLTGSEPAYLRAEVSGGRGESVAGSGALWWPPSKIAGHYLSPYLALRHGLRLEKPDAVTVS
jgi:sulfide:quinone oxidoreductase